MAGFQFSGMVIIFEFVLLLYIFSVCGVIALIPALANNQTNIMGNFQDVPGFQTGNTNNFLVNNTVSNITNSLQTGSFWSMDNVHGIYPVSHDTVLPEDTVIELQPAASLKITNILYNQYNNTQYNNVVFNNLNINETDILFYMDSSYVLTNTYYFLCFDNGIPYIATQNTVGIFLYTSYIGQLGNAIPDGITDISYTFDYNTNLFSLYVNGALWGQTYCKANTNSNLNVANNQLKVITNNYGVDGLNIISDGQTHNVINPYEDYANSYRNMANTFLTVLLWNVEGIPLWFNIIFIKLVLCIFLLPFVLLGIGIITSFIP